MICLLLISITVLQGLPIVLFPNVSNLVEGIGYAQTLIAVALILVNLFSFVFFTLLKTVPFVVDLIWTQDSPMCSLTFGGKAGPYIDQGGSKLRVRLFLKIFQTFHEY